MLVILNGAPKGGSTWLVQIITAMDIFTKIPQKYQDEAWKNSSIKNENIDLFFEEFDFSSKNVYCKQHWYKSGKLENLLQTKNVKMINIIRDIRDVLVSRYYHDLRLNLTKQQDINSYYWQEGKSKIKGYMEYQNSWHQEINEPQPFLCSYERLHIDFISQVKEMIDYLELSDNLKDYINIDQIQKKTSFKNKKNVGEGQFFRKGVIGDWSNHLSNDILQDLENLTIETGYLETKRKMAKLFNLDILKETDFGVR